jgi:putative intracellular protease/amidase
MVGTSATGMKSLGLTPSILMPLPDYDFDPTESSIPWKACVTRGWKITFSTETGSVPQCDGNKLTGPLPGLLSASKHARVAYQQMTEDPAYQHPIPYAAIEPDHYQAILLPGGDGLRVRQYLDSKVLQAKVLHFYQQGKLIGALCHGVLVLARTIDPQTGHSVLYRHKVTATPRSLDRFVYFIDSQLIKHGYIMYPQCVADEVRACLKSQQSFSTGKGLFTPYTVVDGNLVTARWYLDAELFAERFTEALQQKMTA